MENLKQQKRTQPFYMKRPFTLENMNLETAISEKIIETLVTRNHRRRKKNYVSLVRSRHYS